MAVKWQHALALSGVYFYGVAFSDDGGKAVCHTYTPGVGTNDEGILIISIYGGLPNGAISYYFTYPNSNKGYDYMRKNILM